MASILIKFHGKHRYRSDLAQLIELKVRARLSGALERASIVIKCKLTKATLTPAGQIYGPKEEHSTGSLELFDETEVIFKRGTFRSGVVDFCKEHPDDSLVEQQNGHVALMQQCLHRTDQNSVSSDEEDEDAYSTGREIEKHDWVEALFLQASEGVEDQYERIGLVRFTQEAARAVLQAHALVSDRIITLV